MTSMGAIQSMNKSCQRNGRGTGQLAFKFHSNPAMLSRCHRLRRIFSCGNTVNKIIIQQRS